MQGETTGIGGHLGHDVETNAEDNSGIYESDPEKSPGIQSQNWLSSITRQALQSRRKATICPDYKICRS